MHIPAWRHAPLILTLFISILVGCVGSEFIQASLPYKTFQLGDIIANLLGASIGLYAASRMEQRYREHCELQQLYAPLDLENPSEPDTDDVRDPSVLVSPFCIDEDET